MPRDGQEFGDGQYNDAAHIGSAVSNPTLPRKRGRPRKANTPVVLTEAVPTGAPNTETPHIDAVGGGHWSLDIYGVSVSPSSNTVASSIDGGGECHAQGKLIPNPIVPDLAFIVEALYEDQKKRTFCIRSQNRQNNATLAYVRMFLGWSPDLPEKDQKAIRDRAQSIVDKVEKGKPLSGEDKVVGDACSLLILAAVESRKPLDKMRKDIEKHMEKMVKQLPVWEWVQSVKGFGAVGFGVVIGEAGDLSNYSNPGKLWKRMGLAPKDGKAASTWRRTGGLTAADWEEFGYKPSRRSEMWNRAPSLIKAQISKVLDADGEDTGERIATGYYGQVYLDRKRYEIERNPEISRIWAHKRAQAYMEKRLLKHLWQKWRKQPLED